MDKIGGNAIVIREINVNLVRQALKERGKATKRELAEATGLSLVTAATVLQQLVAQGEVSEAGMVSSMGGRPAQQYAYNDEYALALILFPLEHEGRSRLHTYVVTQTGRRLVDTAVDVDQVDLEGFEHVIDGMLERFAAIRAIGFGLPGAEVNGAMVVSDYRALLGLPVTEHFKQRYRLPVIIENDVNAAVIGYCSRLPHADSASVVYVFFPDRFPPGAGIVLDGKLYRGSRGFAGEVSNIPLGIPWGEALNASFEPLTEAIAKLTVSLAGVLNPQQVVLCGSFLQAEHVKEIEKRCGEWLPDGTVPEIRLSPDLIADYLAGMIKLTLAKLEPHWQLTKIDG
ncbi:ROK family protein [Paenibacillus sp. NFR01]|uniref:ROK family transcriptional regulator n=1 Tax=Paenibacillus sp. NFR01 TaxID=1566279 RepID=UPI0008AF12DE|nr:ROK family protein [Paenibacillus sp. NFR01]SET39482.1 ROK family protein [Paenibacillus sp. NFR01]